MLTQKWGVRAPTLLQLLDGLENEDPTIDAIQERADPLEVTIRPGDNRRSDGKRWDPDTGTWVD